MTKTLSPIIVVEKLSKSYVGENSPRQCVLNEMSVSINQGDFIALMGASGSGKTTLLNLIGGLDVADSGSVKCDGSLLNSLSDDQRSEFRLNHIGFIFQTFNLIPNLNVIENVSVPLLFLGRSQKEAQAKAKELISEVGLEGKERRKINELSGGERQRVAIARALIHEPKMILADEPTGNLDSKTGAIILDLLRQINQSHGVTIVMATHDQQSADAADKVIMIHDGMIVDS